MSDRRPNPEPRRDSTMPESAGPAPAPPEDPAARDLADLRAVTSDRIASLDTHIHAARRAGREERKTMSGFRSLRLHPWRAAAGVAAAVALAILVIPVPYSRTVGHDISLRVSAPDAGLAAVKAMAGQLKEQIGGGDVQLVAEDSGNRREFVLKGFVAAGSGIDAGVVADGFASALRGAGYEVAADVVPRVERVSGTVYAMARDRVIRVETAGKTAAEIEAEIRDRLIEAGVSNPEVSVTDEGDNMRRVEVRATRESTDPSDPGSEEPVTLVLTKDGQDVSDENACEIQVKKTRDEAGTVTLVLDAKVRDREAQAVVVNPDALGDAGLAREIESQLRAAGLDVEVQVTDGKFQITPVH